MEYGKVAGEIMTWLGESEAPVATVQIRGSVAQAWDGVEPRGLGTDGMR